MAEDDSGVAPAPGPGFQWNPIKVKYGENAKKNKNHRKPHCPEVRLPRENGLRICKHKGVYPDDPRLLLVSLGPHT